VDCAARFFGHFTKLPFKFAGVIQSEAIYDGRENLPYHSYAAGWLYEQSLEQVAQFRRPAGAHRVALLRVRWNDNRANHSGRRGGERNGIEWTVPATL
jgi:hypothetical protein